MSKAASRGRKSRSHPKRMFSNRIRLFNRLKINENINYFYLTGRTGKDNSLHF